MVSVRRRHPFRGETADLTAKIGTYTARGWTVVVDDNLANLQTLALLAVCHFLDLKAVAGEVEGVVVYPEDVAELAGSTRERMGIVLRDLVKVGVITGTSAAGYIPVGRLLP